MNPIYRRRLQQAIDDQRVATVLYDAPKRGGLVTRFVRPYELSINQRGRSVLWGTDSLHGPRQIHSFRLDRIVSVAVSARAKPFDKAVSITRDLIHEGAAEPPGEPPSAAMVLPRAIGRPQLRRPAPARPAAPYRPRVFVSVSFGVLNGVAVSRR
jgi:predicted DNA-binding transcriptional regulator YafY